MNKVCLLSSLWSVLPTCFSILAATALALTCPQMDHVPHTFMCPTPSGLPEVLQGDEVAEGLRVYRPPFEEFEIQTLTVRRTQKGKTLVLTCPPKR